MADLVEMMPPMQIRPTLVSLFAGCGGSCCGYRAAGYDIRLAVEWDAGAAGIYRRNFHGTAVHEGDISGLSGDEALRLARTAPGELDVLDGSPPCQGFSTAGKRSVGDGRNRGNSVPPPMAEAIGRHVISLLDPSTRSVPANARS